MPIYNFKHLETGEVWEDTMPYNDKASYEVEHNCRSIFLKGPTVIGASRDLYSKTSSGFRDKMSLIKKGYPTKGPNKAKMDNF